MHRAAMAVVVGGYAFGGIGTGLGHQPASNTVNHVVSHAAIVKNAAAMKSVQFRGYEFEVPASWPVYRLDLDPHQCVRYDMHAVYLGAPGTSQDCPARLVGRTETVSVGAPAGGARPLVISQRAAIRGAPASGAPGIILQDASRQELGIAMPASAPSVTATYGNDPGLIERVLASVRHVAAHSVPQSEPDPTAMPTDWPYDSPAYDSPGYDPPADGSSGDIVSDSPTPPQPSPDPATPDPSTVVTLSHGPQAGFDTCTAPPIQAMRDWRAKFSAVGVYIGGEEMACGYGNLSASWVNTVRGLGWSMLPTYVGPQAPCNGFSAKVDPKHAEAQGRQNAQWAIQDAATFGLGKGSPVYYDMEAYDNHNARCVTAVLTFLDGWTRQLASEGYVSGVYSSAASGAIDLANTSRVAGHPLAKPQAIWFALWDNSSDLDGSPYLSRGIWTALHRSKQFSGSHWVKIGRVGLDIDSDLVNGAVAK